MEDKINNMSINAYHYEHRMLNILLPQLDLPDLNKINLRNLIIFLMQHK